MFSSARLRTSRVRFEAELMATGRESVCAKSTASRRAQLAPLPNIVCMLDMSVSEQI